MRKLELGLEGLIAQLQVMDPDWDETVAQANMSAFEEMVAAAKKTADSPRVPDYPLGSMLSAYDLQSELDQRDRTGVRGLRRQLTTLRSNLAILTKQFPAARKAAEELSEQI